MILLLAGALVNAAVAWACALWSDLPLGKQFTAPTPSEAAWWQAHAPAVIGSDPIVVGIKAGRGLTVKQLSGLRHHPAVDIDPQISNSGEWFMATVIASDPPVAPLRWDHVTQTLAGWPFRSLSGDRWQGGDMAFTIRDPDERRCALQRDSFPRPRDVYRAAIPVPRGRPTDSPGGLLPLWPVWPGFAVNAVLYGAALSVLAAALAGLRRFIRVRLRRCPACAYPMGDSPVCTECGQPLPRRAVA
ncbi:MAG: hypothetical protein ACYSWT_12940 [Planctomycetota bacterium]